MWPKLRWLCARCPAPTNPVRFAGKGQRVEVATLGPFDSRGEIEEWVDREKRILRPGDSAFIAADVVHASFNFSDRNARLLAILGPCIGLVGYELVDVADQEPWVSLKTT
jgi:hypothetical protein